ncbi:MAG TPA: YHS domain-containing (seleno)protein [Kofleriaceae bacterium]|nr:YHS domain-containing (seleno)protein [Kofleriaceae bacterium]
MVIKFVSRMFVLLSVLFLTSSLALAGDYFEKDGVALRGYDPVAYFTAGKPTMGSAAHSFTYKGSKFYFATAENQKAFEKNPEKYAPQFGGYCAFGTANGVKVSTQPEAFAVVGGKLYLNHDPQTHEKWKADPPGNISKAQKNWPEVQKKDQLDK